MWDGNITKVSVKSPYSVGGNITKVSVKDQYCTVWVVKHQGTVKSQYSVGGNITKVQ